jgi:DNA-binding GntR family transcriptional regulator
MTPSSGRLDWIHSHPRRTAVKTTTLTEATNGVMYAKTMSAQPAIGPLQIQSVVDHVYSALRERILSGDLPRGTKLRQASLADELGVSRTPLREALRRLSTEGLVEFSPNRGATVSELDFGDMRHAWSARVALEPGAARLAAERRDQRGIAAMRAAIDRQRSVAGDTIESFAANRAFHLALAMASGNPHLTRFAEMLWVPRIGVPIYQAQAVAPAGAQAWADEHERIAEAIAAGDADAAERLTREHVQAHPPVAPAVR